jgi:hypothetical protein
MRKPKMTTGKKLRKEWNIPARGVYFHQDGTFYEIPTVFPAALCDMSGYVIFSSLDELKHTVGISVSSKVNITDELSMIAGYTKSHKPIPKEIDISEFV